LESKDPAPIPDPPSRRSVHLADRDTPCAACGYNLRGLTGDRCPECGTPIPEPPPPQQQTTLKQFLRGRDLYCKHCKYNLRDLEGNTCPECGTVYYLAGGTGRTDARAAPLHPGEFAAGCLAVAAVPGVFLVLFRTALGVWGGGSNVWTGNALLVGILVLMPAALLVVLGLCRRQLNRLRPRRGWAVVAGLTATGLAAAVLGLLLAR